MAQNKRNAVVGQSGGPTAVINQSLVGVILEARAAGHIGKLLGSRHGVRGIVNNDFIDLDTIPAELLERIANTPAAGLGSTRDKPDRDYCNRIFESFKKNDVGYFFYIGGNDSADTARIVSDLAKSEGYELAVFHVPKTIDNDLRVHDHCPGYGSAARFVASAMLGDNYDNASLPGIKVDIVMGRNAGFLTAASVLARQHDEDGPHLIYVPECRSARRNFSPMSIGLLEEEALPDRSERRDHISKRQDLGRAHRQPPGARCARQHAALRFGALGDYMSDLIKKKLASPGGKSLRVRADTFGYVQRCFPESVSQVDRAEARTVGQLAVRHSKEPGASGSIAMRRKAGQGYEIEYFLTPLSTVARETKKMDPEYIAGGNNITQAFVDYVSPLVGKLPVVGSFDELGKR